MNKENNLINLVEEKKLLSSIFNIILERQEVVQLKTVPGAKPSDNLMWESADVEIATVTNIGKVTAIDIGRTQIHVKNDRLTFEDYINVRVVDLGEARDLRVAIQLKVGELIKLSLDDAEYSVWKSLDTSVAVVSETGEIIGLSEGMALITATYGGEVNVIYVIVKKLDEEVTEPLEFIDFFPDEVLAIRIAQAMNGSGATIHDAVTEEELNNFNNNSRTLDLDSNNTSRRIQSIEGLQHLTSITGLRISNNQIIDISPLSNLNSLSSLSLDTNQINDINPLSNLTLLSVLQLDNNQISDLTPVQHLNSVRASNQKIILKPIVYGEVTEITIRDIDGSTPRITFRPNGGSYNSEEGTITWGGIGNNSLNWDTHNFFFSGTITQYVESAEEKPSEPKSFLDFFPDVNLATGVAQSVRGRNATPEEIVTLEELNSFNRSLTLNHMGIQSIEGLQYLTSITVLRISHNQIGDLTPLSNLTSLTLLEVNRNQISDLTPLSSLNSLTVLLISNNRIIDISPLSNLTSLPSLSLTGNQISDIIPLSNLASLSSLALQNNLISQLTPLSNSISSIALLLENNQISDLTPIKHVPVVVATNQRIILEPMVNGEVTEITIRDIDGSTPRITFRPNWSS